MSNALDKETLQQASPKLAEITNSLLFGDIWQRDILTPRERSLITLACLAALGREKQLGWHMRFAAENGLSRRELSEVFTHLAFYAGWPAAVTALHYLPESDLPKEESPCR
ncbi:MAG TPA: carboxymuconolactone decarboxylase [Pantoea sp.]|uniref:carboxymuconolactone decarboxylase family protein n=1 Tax=Pantoea TaxID=53335 RepID=UPI000BB59B46|nr:MULTISPECIES: carboxymuconolactone decarboxylase family protein [Pantoea]PNK70482.1 carboxymuconolactone decarboxylase [Pantoea sp. FDAARGOS_194]HAK34752.1 carboxymuconolactone decarboxylase [Pantoea sp.]